jgi:hypothetical protein
MLRQFLPIGGSGAAPVHRETDRLIPARSGQILAETGLLAREGVLPPVQALYPTSLRYLDQPTCSFDVSSNELVRLKYAVVHRWSNNAGRSQFMGGFNAK